MVVAKTPPQGSSRVGRLSVRGLGVLAGSQLGGVTVIGHIGSIPSSSADNVDRDERSLRLGHKKRPPRPRLKHTAT